MKKSVFSYSALLWVVACIFLLSCQKKDESTSIDDPEFNLPFFEIGLRDPSVLVDHKSKFYYIHVNGGGKTNVFKSKDLKMWKKLDKPSFQPDATFWGTKDFWAPDVYEYQNKYYMFITVSSNTQKRGTTILVSDSPEGSFEPLTNEPITPKEWMCLDGSLYIDKDNQPWIIFCREWLEVRDGEIYAQKLSADFKNVIDEPVLLFKASEAPWAGTITVGGTTGYVTDAPVVHTLDNNVLAMTWSSFDKSNRYAIGQATSVSGSVLGPWQQSATTLNYDNGGHAMLFRDFNNQLKISYHSPNNPNSKLTIYNVLINNQQIRIDYN